MYTPLIRPLLFRLDPERAHNWTTTLGTGFCSLPVVGRRLVRRHASAWSGLAQDLSGIRFPNPIGIAAGFDKNASYTALLRFMGFGYAEYGSITAQPSTGNPRPRLFRLKTDRALINRMGLNNDGACSVCRNILNKQKQDPELFGDFPCGINIAKTHDPGITGDDAIRDYLNSYRHAREPADYITLNVSCPNTREGKTFEDKSALKELLDAIKSERQQGDPPLFVKFSPDNDAAGLENLIAACENRGVQGYVLTNTSKKREGLRTPSERLDAIGPGGLSGAPLFTGTLGHISRLRPLLPKKRVLIACGGIDSPAKALQLIAAGADLLQIYTGLVYEGPSLVKRINETLVREMYDKGISGLEQRPVQFS